MITGGQTNRYSNVLKKCSPYLRHELWPTIRNKVLRDPKQPKYMIKQGFSSLERNGMNLTPLENLSISVRIVLKPCESGRSVTKSMAKWDQGLAGIGRGINLPAGRVFGVLHWELVEHDWTNECMSLSIDFHQYLWANSWCVRVSPGWPEVKDEWAQVTSLSQNWLGT